MPTFEAERGGLLWDATAVPNAFFCEYMPAAPDSHVKVYLYGLMCAHGGVQEEGDLLDDVARSLALSRDEVECAMRYWERCRLVERVKDTPPVYRFLSVQQAMLKRREAPPRRGLRGLCPGGIRRLRRPAQAPRRRNRAGLRMGGAAEIAR